VTDDELARQAERLLRRYLVEVVERFDLCPWARRARERGEVCIEVLVEPAPAPAALAAAAARIVEAAPLGMIVLPRARPTPRALRRLRDELAHVRADQPPPVGIADFHPDAPVDLSSPDRAVAGLRRAPDPMLQVVRLDVLAAARAAPPAPDRTAQAAILAGRAPTPAAGVPDRIAAANLAVARAEATAIARAIAAIHDDRDQTYAALTASCR
jgi:hypothetical protein